jgi:hypothetical protein
VSLALLERAGAKPTHAHPYLATLGLASSADAESSGALLLFERSFDGAFEAAARYSLPEACARVLVKLPFAKNLSKIERLLTNVAIGRYTTAEGILPRILGVSSNPRTLTHLMRQLRNSWGEPYVREIYNSVKGGESWLQLPITVIREAVERALPMFSRKLD